VLDARVFFLFLNCLQVASTLWNFFVRPKTKMIQASIFPGRYVQGAGALNRLGKEAARFGKKLLQFAIRLQLIRLFQDIKRKLKKKLKLFLRNSVENAQIRKSIALLNWSKRLAHKL
jgi:hypothetical protein